MTTLLLAVMGQAKYVCAVHRFIQELLLKAAPELLKGSGALKSDKEFKDTIDVAIASVTTPHAKERDYVRAIVETSSAEMKPLCHLLRGAAEVVGLGELAARYLDGTRFREMLLRKDEEKLERLNVTVQTQGPIAPVKILMDVAAELDGRAENYELIGIPGTLTILDPQGIDELTTDYGDGTFYVYDAHGRRRETQSRARHDQAHRKGRRDAQRD